VGAEGIEPPTTSL